MRGWGGPFSSSAYLLRGDEPSSSGSLGPGTAVASLPSGRAACPHCFSSPMGLTPALLNCLLSCVSSRAHSERAALLDELRRGRITRLRGWPSLPWCVGGGVVGVGGREHVGCGGSGHEGSYEARRGSDKTERLIGGT